MFVTLAGMFTVVIRLTCQNAPLPIFVKLEGIVIVAGFVLKNANAPMFVQCEQLNTSPVIFPRVVVSAVLL